MSEQVTSCGETSAVGSDLVNLVQDPGNTAVVQPVKPVEKLPEKVMGQLDYLAMSSSFGNIDTDPGQQAVLFAAVGDEEVEIRPDGLVYLPWMGYVMRLRNAFGTSWGLLPQGKPIIRDGFVLWGFYLIIKGKMASYAIGECEQTSRMTYGECAEGAKSNALMRLCKGMGISLELWQPSFIRRWISSNAVQDVPDPKREGKFLWRRKPVGTVEIKLSEQPVSAGDTPPPTPPPAVLEPVLSDANKVKGVMESGPSDVVKSEKLPDPAPVSAPPPPADDAPVEGSVRKTVYIKVSGVNVHKPGPRSKVRNPSYRVMGSVAGSPYYYTFDKTFAVIAKESMKTGNVIRIEYDVTPFGLKIFSLKSGPFDQVLPIK